MLKVNTEGTANLMNACLHCGVEKVCYVSSIASLGKALDGGVIDEQVEWQADDHRSAYSYSKFRAEMEVWRETYCRNRRSEEHTSELQSRPHLVCRLLLEKKNKKKRRKHQQTYRRVSSDLKTLSVSV